MLRVRTGGVEVEGCMLLNHNNGNTNSRQGSFLKKEKRKGVEFRGFLTILSAASFAHTLK